MQLPRSKYKRLAWIHYCAQNCDYVLQSPLNIELILNFSHPNRHWGNDLDSVRQKVTDNG